MVETRLLQSLDKKPGQLPEATPDAAGPRALPAAQQTFEVKLEACSANFCRRCRVYNCFTHPGPHVRCACMPCLPVQPILQTILTSLITDSVLQATPPLVSLKEAGDGQWTLRASVLARQAAATLWSGSRRVGLCSSRSSSSNGLSS